MMKMKQKRHTLEEIVDKLARARSLEGLGLSPKLVCRRLRISAITLYRWRRRYGQLTHDDVRRIRAEQHEDACRLRSAMAMFRSAVAHAQFRFDGEPLPHDA